MTAMWIRAQAALAALATLAFFAPAAQALNVDWIDVFWLTDSIDGTLITDPYGMEVSVELLDAVNLDRVEVVTPGTAGTFDLANVIGLEYEIPGTVTSQFSSNAALVSAFSGGSWTFNFRDATDALLDSFSITLSPDDVSNIIDINNVTHLGNFTLGSSVDWNDCSGCDGGRIQGFAVELGSDIDADEFSTTDLSTSTWTPANLVAGNDYEFEMILGNYENFGTSEVTTGGDPFSFAAGYENINILQVTAVPEPGTGLLLGAGLVLLGFRSRRRS